MNEKGQNTLVNPFEDTATTDREKTIPTPHFDALAVKKARPAVPLSLRRDRKWPTGMLISIAIVAGLVGGFIGGLLPRFYQTDETKQTDTAQRTEPRDEVIGQQPAQPLATSVTDHQGPGKKTSSPPPDERADKPTEDTEATLRGALRSWVAATNARDLE